MITETPEQWVVISLPATAHRPEHWRVFAGWRGGYLSEDRWKLNSGITQVVEEAEHIIFYGASGSGYRCHKQGYGLREGLYHFSSYCQGVLEYKTAGEGIEILPHTTDWTQLV